MIDIGMRGIILANLYSKEELAQLAELLARNDSGLQDSRIHDDVSRALLEACARGY